MLSYENALNLTLEQARQLQTEQVLLSDAGSRILAQSVGADRDYPPFDRSAMDGYALRFDDLSDETRDLDVVGESRAGEWPEFEIGPNQACKIMTGAPVPMGADTVVMVENTTATGSRVHVDHRPSAQGTNVCYRGEDVLQGSTILQPGTVLRPAACGVLASVGLAQVRVYRRPRVAVLATGDELIDVEATPLSHQIRDSNRYVMAEIARSVGADVTDLGRVADTMSALESALRIGFSHDVLLLSGGVSMGDYDLVGKALTAMGARTVFHKINLKPGKPLLVATADNTLIFGLPGNPVSTAVCAQLFVGPALLKMQGAAHYRSMGCRAVAETPVRGSGRRETFYPGTFSYRDGRAVVSFCQLSGSGDLFGFSQGNCVIRRHPNSEPVQPGAEVEIILAPQTILS